MALAGCLFSSLPGLAGCRFVRGGDLAERLDADADGWPAAADCNDANPDVGDPRDLVPGGATDPARQLACGQTHPGDLADGADVLGTVNCAHPGGDGRLADAGLVEAVWWLPFSAPGRARVEVSGGLTQRLGLDGVAELQGAFLFAWLGDTCERDTCSVGLPLLGHGAGEAVLSEQPVSLTVRGDAGDVAWIAVTGDGGEYALSVDCGG